MRSAWLVCSSYLFYLYEPSHSTYFSLLLGITFFTYLSAFVIFYAKRKKTRNIMLLISIIVCISLFLWFKYANSIRTLFGLSVGQTISMPLGLSYFLFMALGYLIDIARKKYTPIRNIFHYALFVSFFPLMTAGPIERANHLCTQFEKPVSFNYTRFTSGLFRILWGFYKKMVIADSIGSIVQPVYSNLFFDAYTGPVLLLVSLLFPLQLYYDFSACTDIAIGAGQMLGFDFLENFNRPFAASSFSELWKRWHISLTSWLREYVYFSLGGNRLGKTRTKINQIITFIVSGLWHGSSFSYFIWGLLNGIYLSFESSFSRKKNTSKLILRKKIHYRILGIIRTYLLFTSCIIFFITGLYSASGHAVSDAFYVYGHLFTGWDQFFFQFSQFLSTLSSIGFTPNLVFALITGIIFIESLEFFRIPMHQFIQKIPVYLRWPFYYSLILLILFFGSFGKSSFIYQNY